MRGEAMSGGAAAPARFSALWEARRLVRAGVLIGCCVVPVTMLPGGFNPFGPAKAFALSFGVLAVLLGLALDPALAVRAWRCLRASGPAWALGAYAALTLLAAVMSYDIGSSLRGTYPEYQGVIALLAYLVIAFGIASLPAEEPLPLLARGLTVSLLVVGAYALAQMLGFDPLGYRFGLDLERARSMAGNASNLGLFLVLALPYAVAAARVGTRAWRACAVAGIALGLVALTGTSSRGAWVGVLAGAAVWLAVEMPAWERERRKRTLIVIGSALVLVALGAAILFPGVVRRAGSAFDPAGGTALWRRSVWSSAFQMSADRPVLGWGPNTFGLVYPLYRHADLETGVADSAVVADAHNLFVNTLAERGVLALLALAAWFVLLILDAVKGSRARRGALFSAPLAATAAGLVALQFHFLTLDTGALFVGGAVLAGLLAVRAEDAAAARESVALSSLGRTLAWVAVAPAALLVVATGGLLVADLAVERGMASAAEARPVSLISQEFERATLAARWEPAVPWAHGTAMALLLRDATAGREAYDTGAEAFSLALEKLPHDRALAEDRADLSLVAGIALEDPTLFQEALRRYDELLADDPDNPSLQAGRAAATGLPAQMLQAE